MSEGEYWNHISTAVKIEAIYPNCVGEMYQNTRMVCPFCAQEQHEQGDSYFVHDCKNLFYVWVDADGNKVFEEMQWLLERIRKAGNPVGCHKMKTVGQCCCWSKAHGVRKKRLVV